jgi:hypothetical protein
MDSVFHLRAWSLRFVSYSRRQPKWNPCKSSVVRGRSFGSYLVSRKHAILSDGGNSFSRPFSSGTEETRRIRNLLQKFEEGDLDLEDAIVELSKLQITDEQSPTDVLSSFANLDYHRSERTNFPEVVFAQGKTPEQVKMILEAMAEKNSTKAVQNRTPILATRYVRFLHLSNHP